MNQRTAVILCGALAREVRAVAEQEKWPVDLFAVNASLHLRPENIAGALEAKLGQIAGRYDRIAVVYGDCGTGGRIDEVLSRYGAQRVPGPHCYEMYAGDRFDALMEEDIGTFFLTDFLVRTFEGTIVRPLGLDRYPDLRNDYFAHYHRLVYLAQTDDAALQSKAQTIANRLHLPLIVRFTGAGNLAGRLRAIVQG